MEISREEFNKLYGDVEVEFTSYYKYSFTFTGVEPQRGMRIVVTIGGCADDIYKMDVTAGEKVKVRDCYATYAGAYYGEDAEDPVHSYAEYL